MLSVWLLCLVWIQTFLNCQCVVTCLQHSSHSSPAAQEQECSPTVVTPKKPSGSSLCSLGCSWDSNRDNKIHLWKRPDSWWSLQPVMWTGVFDIRLAAAIWEETEFNSSAGKRREIWRQETDSGSVRVQGKLCRVWKKTLQKQMISDWSLVVETPLRRLNHCL